jgi:hypothetical protein
MTGTRHGTSKVYTHLFFIGARPQNWTETLWKKRLWSQTITLNNVLFSWFRNIYLLNIWVITLCKIVHSIWRMSQCIWFALYGCVYFIHHEDFLTVYYISVLMYCMCQLLYLCVWYYEILYQGLLLCGNLLVYKLPVPLIGPLEVDLLCV